MTWFLFAALTAISESLKDVISKRSLKNVDEYIVAWSLAGFTLPILLPILLIIDIPALNSQFWYALLVSGGLNVLSWILYIKAIKSDLSITVPLITFTPLFILVTSPVIVQEYPSAVDTVGILLIVLGSYTLNLKKKTQGYLAPFKALLSQEGPKLMLGVAFIWSISSNVDKIGVQNSSPTFWAIALFSFVALGILPITLYKSRRHFGQVIEHFPSLFPIGVFNSSAILFQMKAIDIALVAQVIAVKRMSALITVFLGYLIFKEKNIRERALGAAIMILGVILITL